MNNTQQHYAPIGIFDSWRWGYYTLQEIKKLLPHYDYLFYGDIARMPYGDKTPEQIRTHTFDGLNWLFDQGCQIVIIACNTAASYAIRVRQATYPDKKTLSVTIPWVEALIDSKVDSALFLSTVATRESWILPDLALKYGYQWSLNIKPCSWFADLIEEDMKVPFTQDKKKEIVRQYVWEQWPNAESIVLACTHYGVWYDTFESLYPDTLIIDPSQETALKLVNYLTRHPEIEEKISRGGEVKEYWTK